MTPSSKEWEHCPHYGLGPSDQHGVAICAQCGAAVQMRISGVPVDEFYAQASTVVAQEGDDVPFDWPGEG